MDFVVVSASFVPFYSLSDNIITLYLSEGKVAMLCYAILCSAYLQPPCLLRRNGEAPSPRDAAAPEDCTGLHCTTVQLRSLRPSGAWLADRLTTDNT